MSKKMTRYKLDKYKDEIINLYVDEKLSCAKIAKLYNAHLCGIYDALKRWDIKTRNLSESHKLYKVNDNYFKKIDNEEKAYWLGFIYADGYITKPSNIGIALKDVDDLHLKKFLKCINSDYPINYYVSSGYGECNYARIIINSVEMFNDLLSKGVKLKKSLVIEFPDEQIVPKELQLAFIRGYFDGDGSLILSKNSINIKLCGTEEFLSKVIEVFNEVSQYKFQKKLFKRYNDEKNNYYISYGGRYKVISILSKLYDDANIFLDRKIEKYYKLING